MKIEIEFTSSYEATMTIDGRKLTYKLIGRSSGLQGLPEGQTCEDSIGGMVAQKLCNQLTDILQGWMPDEQNAEDCCWGTWERLSEKANDQVFEAISPWS